MHLWIKNAKVFGGAIFGHLWGLRRFTKNGTTFSYGIRITKLLARWKDGCEGYVIYLYKYSFGFYIVSSYCNLGKFMVHLYGFLLWWHMSFMDRAHLGSWYVSLSLGISLWIHYICYELYNDGHLGIDMVWFLYISLYCDGHASHGLGSILLSWKCMNFVHVLVLISWHNWW